jgi:predicted nucleic acid-binding protein
LPSFFADAVYLIALLLPNDDLHSRAMEIAGAPGEKSFVTIDAVLVEVLAYAAERGPHIRQQAVGLIDDLIVDPAWTLIRQVPDHFDRAFDLYRRRLDKGYSLTDCMSMVVCTDLGIAEVLSHDHHFEQEGFAILL